LGAEFKCVGAIDSSLSQCTGSNDDEQPASTVAASLEPAAQTYNAGFLRDDAVLVAVGITDEDEQPVYTQATTADAVYQRVIKTKGGNVKRTVFLGIGGSSDCSGVYGTARTATKLKAITNKFIAQDRGVWWDLCKGRLEDGLAAAIAKVRTACSAFEESGGAGAPCERSGQCSSGSCGTNGFCEGGSGTAGSPCTLSSQCASGTCDNGACRSPAGAPCQSNSQCSSNVCGSNGFCEGGGSSGGTGTVPNGGACTVGSQCAAGTCQNNVCGAPAGAACTQSSQCITHVCGSTGFCEGAANGTPCSTNSQCASGFCNNGQCTGEYL
jgi:hypothetical protein